jgi:hypothetical protein
VANDEHARSEKPGAFTGNLADTTATSDEFKMTDLVKELAENSLLLCIFLLGLGVLLSLAPFALAWVCAAAGLGDFIRGVGGNVLAAGLVIAVYRLISRLNRIGWFRRHTLWLRVGE